MIVLLLEPEDRVVVVAFSDTVVFFLRAGLLKRTCSGWRVAFQRKAYWHP